MCSAISFHHIKVGLVFMEMMAIVELEASCRRRCLVWCCRSDHAPVRELPSLTGRREVESLHHHAPSSTTHRAARCHLMPFPKGGLLVRLICSAPKNLPSARLRLLPCQSWVHSQTRRQHNRVPRPIRDSRQPVQSQYPRPSRQTQTVETPVSPQRAEDPQIGNVQWPNIQVRYLRPAIWAIVVSGGIFAGLAYLEAKKELKPKKSMTWPEAPQWGMQKRGPPTPTEMATQWWSQLNPVSRVSCGLIAANSVVHLSSYVLPNFWSSLWHMPARNVNYTLFTSMFVHSGGFHLAVNMYGTYNFMIPVGYSKVFEGNPYHILSFFLATGVLSGFAQHWATLITPQKRAIPEIFIRCGGASGALLGVLGLFCMEYPTAGLGIILIPVHFDAQYVLPAVMLFDFIGMVRGYSFVNFGHAVSYV
jgi:rhomboid-like protein